MATLAGDLRDDPVKAVTGVAKVLAAGEEAHQAADRAAQVGEAHLAAGAEVTPGNLRIAKGNAVHLSRKVFGAGAHWAAHRLSACARMRCSADFPRHAADLALVADYSPCGAFR